MGAEQWESLSFNLLKVWWSCEEQRQLQTGGLRSLQVDKDLRTMLVKPDALAPQMVGVRVWPRAIPQFNVGHLDTLEVCLRAACVSILYALGPT